MKTPDFFNDVPSITMSDPLSRLLGAAEKGILTYTYEDIVKLAGHSCPTVAGAYLMVRKGVTELYGEDTPVRGEIKIQMRGKLGEGTIGVVANVASMITGAAQSGGFHGLGGMFDRRGLLCFDADIEGEMVLERVDTQERVILSYNPSMVPVEGEMGELLPLIISGRAEASAVETFGIMWQDRVKKILIDHREDPRLVQCRYYQGGEKE
ncbi:MAG: hypothetical protein M0P91_08665 [Sulfuricurvum sp.]|uniref:hypothetical protein n=1 Tax=Sulfuricurvum sp. TaxID=2025608 RepID=UPI0025D835E5|nr:hypothetical protein [Sulfuricurvum sp.]MCK9373257.1 hypothetical protein [Sulfuricurvum sp.]